MEAVRHQDHVKQWHRIEALVKEWLEERRHLIYLLCAIQGIRGLTFEGMPVHFRVQQFCQVLMDYISAGHFEIYRELIREGRSFHRENPALIAKILEQLEDSTDEALAFNEDFDTPEHCEQMLDTLPMRLSQLLEKLEERFALEDQLIVSIHQEGFPAGSRVH
jgi:regulator of sigma D